MVYVFFASGFEEIEALTAVDILRRGGVMVTTVGVDGKTVAGSHGIPILCDKTIKEGEFDDIDALVLPGGMPGTMHLGENSLLCTLLHTTAKQGKTIAAICAAPSLLGREGLLKNRFFTCYPGYEKAAANATYTGEQVCVDRGDFPLITANGPASAAAFAFALLKELKGTSVMQKLAEDMQFKKGGTV